MRLQQMSGDLAHLGCIGTARTHPVLRLAHFGCRHHLHGFGDLARVLHALDLSSNFLDSGHRSFLKGRYDRTRLGPALRMDTEAAMLHHPKQRSEEHTSELQSLMRISYAVFCLKKKKQTY